MRRFICGLLAGLLLISASPRNLAAEEKCGWREVGRYEVYNMLTGEIEITIYYEYFCFGSKEA